MVEDEEYEPPSSDEEDTEISVQNHGARGGSKEVRLDVM